MPHRQPLAAGGPPQRGGAYIRPRLAAALAAGVPAIAVNTLLLQAGTWMGIESGHGGLLRWLRLQLAPVFEASGLSGRWPRLPAVSSATVALVFHVAVGLVMALFYAFAVEPVCRRRPRLEQGLLYAGAIWLINAAIVLPGLGEGFAGREHLDGLGLAYFAFAHTSFFVLLALAYRRPPEARP